MENSRKILGSFIIICLVLFGNFIYPGVGYFEKLGIIYYMTCFLGLSTYIAYLHLELNNKRDKNISLNHKTENFVTEEGRKFTDFFSNNADPNEKYHKLTTHLMKTIKQSLFCDFAFFYLYNDIENYYRLQHFESDSDLSLNEIIEGNEFFNTFRDKGKPALFNQEELFNLGLAHYPQKHEIKSLMLVPLFFNGFIGFLGVDNNVKNAWGHHDLELLEDYTNIIIQFISQLDNMESLNHKIDFLREVEDLNLSIQNEQDFMTVYRNYISLIGKYLSYDKLSIISYDRKKNHEASVEFIDGVETDYTVGHHFGIENTIFKKIIETEEFIISDYQQSDIIFRFKPNDLNVLPFKSGIGVSMNINKDIQICLILESFNANNYSKSDYKLLKTICINLEKNYIRNFEYRIVKDLSLIDSLTKIFNHKSLKDQLKNEIERCKRYENQLSYLMIDIDKFKKVNDDNGHLFGDYVLRKIAQILKTSVRKIDII